LESFGLKGGKKRIPAKILKGDTGQLKPGGKTKKIKGGGKKRSLLRLKELHPQRGKESHWRGKKGGGPERKKAKRGETKTHFLDDTP